MCSGEQVRWRRGGHRRGEEEVSGARWRAPVGAHWRGGAGDRAVGRWRAPAAAQWGGRARGGVVAGSGGGAIGYARERAQKRERREGSHTVT
jgi:hypothetical protein